MFVIPRGRNRPLTGIVRIARYPNGIAISAESPILGELLGYGAMLIPLFIAYRLAFVTGTALAFGVGALALFALQLLIPIAFLLRALSHAGTTLNEGAPL